MVVPAHVATDGFAHGKHDFHSLFHARFSVESMHALGIQLVFGSCVHVDASFFRIAVIKETFVVFQSPGQLVILIKEVGISFAVNDNPILALGPHTSLRRSM